MPDALQNWRWLRVATSIPYCRTPNPTGVNSLWGLSRFVLCARWVFRKPEQAFLPPKPDLNLTTAIFKSDNLKLQEARSN